MLQFDYEGLSALGLTPAIAGRAAALAVEASDADRESPSWLGRVAEVHRETLVLQDALGQAAARVKPRLTRCLAEDGTALAVGDWVLGQADVHGAHWVVARVAPINHLARVDGYGRRHPVVSNVDVALLVMGLDADFNARRLERYLALAQQEDILPVVVLTKLDVARAAGEPVEERVADLEQRIGRAIEMVAVDATDASAAAALRPYLARGHTLVLLGSSGAGKSTLTNTLLGSGVQDTGPVRASDGRGMHTTTVRSLHRLPMGALHRRHAGDPHASARRRRGCAGGDVLRHRRAGGALPLRRLPARERARLRRARCGRSRPPAQLAKARARDGGAASLLSTVSGSSRSGRRGARRVLRGCGSNGARREPRCRVGVPAARQR